MRLALNLGPQPDFACCWVDSGDALCLPHIRPHITLDELQLVQIPHRSVPIFHLQSHAMRCDGSLELMLLNDDTSKLHESVFWSKTPTPGPGMCPAALGAQRPCLHTGPEFQRFRVDSGQCGGAVTDDQVRIGPSSVCDSPSVLHQPPMTFEMQHSDLNLR